MIKEETIRKLVDYILLNACSVNSSGLYNGKAGMALALFEAARLLNDEKIESKAFDLFQESLIRHNNDFGFEDGLSGLGYVLIYLIINRFIDADFDEIYKDSCEKILDNYENIDNQPERIIASLKVIYFMTSLHEVNYKDIRISQITNKIFEGIELYLSLQFFDWKNINYINNKEFVLQIFETYLRLIDFAKYKNFSQYLISSYVELYRNSRVASSIPIGFYLNNICKQNEIREYLDVGNNNISNGLKNIHLDLLSLEEKISLKKIIDGLKNTNCGFSPANIDIYGGNINKIKSMVRRSHPQYGYQFGLSRYLIFCVNKEFVLI